MKAAIQIWSTCMMIVGLSGDVFKFLPPAACIALVIPFLVCAAIEKWKVR